MNLLLPSRALIRWINFLPVWRAVRVRVWGNRLRAPNFDRLLCLLLHRVGLMGKADHAFLLTHVRPGMTVVDIGANQGLYTLLFSRCAGPTGCILAFEPDDALHAALEENIAYNRVQNVQSYCVALGARDETLTLHRSLLNSGDNRLVLDGHKGNDSDSTRVRVERLDVMFAGRRIDFIKMDVQGWEMEVLRGMEALLDDPCNAALTIYFEYWPQGLHDAGSNPLEPLTFLSEKGFALFHINGQATRIIRDLNGFTRSTREGSYVNLFASRCSPGERKI